MSQPDFQRDKQRSRPVDNGGDTRDCHGGQGQGKPKPFERNAKEAGENLCVHRHQAVAS